MSAEPTLVSAKMSAGEVQSSNVMEESVTDAKVTFRGSREAGLLNVFLRLIQAGPLLVLFAIVIAFSFLSPVFFTKTNLTNILVQSSVVALLALGAFLVIMVGTLDLSLGASAGLCTVVGAELFQHAPNLGWAVIPIMLLTGAVGGSVNATIITGMQLGNSFIVTLGTLYAFQSLSYIVSSGGGQIQGLPGAILKLANGSVVGIPAPVFLVAGCVLCISVMLKKTVWGRWIVAIGGNREAAERIGIPTRRVVGSVYIFAGLMAGAAALLIAGLADAGYPDQGNNILFAIAAVIVGGASLSGGRGTVLWTATGAVILASINNGLTLMSISANWTPFAIGVVLVAAVAVDRVRSKIERRLSLRQAQLHVGSQP